MEGVPNDGTPLQEVVQHVPTLQGKPPFPDFIDNTARSDFILCPRKFFYSFIFSLAPAAPSIHLHAGGAFAKGLEVARTAYWEHKQSVGEAKRLGLQAIIKTYGAFVAPPTKQGDKSLENVIKAFDSYMLRYPLDRDIIRPYRTDSGRYMIEFTFAMPTEVLNPSTGQPILYKGRADMIGTVDDQSLWITDEKTATQLGEQWANNWELDSQFTGYIAAARSYGYNVAGALVRGVGLLKTKISHAEAQVYRGTWEVERWWAQLQKDLRRMVAAYKAWDFDYALSKSACNAFGGCSFAPLDKSPNPEKWLNQYRIRVWDPTKPDFGENLLSNPALTQTPNDDIVIDLKELM